MRVAVLGAGSWGTAFAIHLNKLGFSVKVWEYFPENVSIITKTHRNPLLPGIPIPPAIFVSNDISEVVDDCEVIVVAVPSHTVRKVLKGIKGRTNGKIIVNLSKGIEEDTLLRMSQVIHQVLEHPYNMIVTLHGPSHAEEVAREIPTCVVAASTDMETARFVQEQFMTTYFRIYRTIDIIGVEIGGAIKNVIAIAAGICDGLALGDNSKAALITRGLFEITRMGVKLGAWEQTFAGLSGVGDLIVTCNSRYSRNRYIGEEIGKGRKLQDVLSGMTMVAEGVRTCHTVHQMSKKYKVSMPISEQVYKILFEDKSPREALTELMTRDPVEERHSLPEIL